MWVYQEMTRIICVNQKMNFISSFLPQGFTEISSRENGAICLSWYLMQFIFCCIKFKCASQLQAPENNTNNKTQMLHCTYAALKTVIIIVSKRFKKILIIKRFYIFNK